MPHAPPQQLGPAPPRRAVRRHPARRPGVPRHGLPPAVLHSAVCHPAHRWLPGALAGEPDRPGHQDRAAAAGLPGGCAACALAAPPLASASPACASALAPAHLLAPEAPQALADAARPVAACPVCPGWAAAPALPGVHNLVLLFAWWLPAPAPSLPARPAPLPGHCPPQGEWLRGYQAMEERPQQMPPGTGGAAWGGGGLLNSRLGESGLEAPSGSKSTDATRKGGGMQLCMLYCCLVRPGPPTPTPYSPGPARAGPLTSPFELALVPTACCLATATLQAPWPPPALLPRRRAGPGSAVQRLCAPHQRAELVVPAGLPCWLPAVDILSRVRLRGQHSRRRCSVIAASTAKRSTLSPAPSHCASCC